MKFLQWQHNSTGATIMLIYMYITKRLLSDLLIAISKDVWKGPLGRGSSFFTIYGRIRVSEHFIEEATNIKAKGFIAGQHNFLLNTKTWDIICRWRFIFFTFFFEDHKNLAVVSDEQGVRSHQNIMAI